MILRAQSVLPIYHASRHAKEASITGPVLAYDHVFGEKLDPRVGGLDGHATLARLLVSDESDVFASPWISGVQVPVALGKLQLEGVVRATRDVQKNANTVHAVKQRFLLAAVGPLVHLHSDTFGSGSDFGSPACDTI